MRLGLPTVLTTWRGLRPPRSRYGMDYMVLMPFYNRDHQFRFLHMLYTEHPRAGLRAAAFEDVQQVNQVGLNRRLTVLWNTEPWVCGAYLIPEHPHPHYRRNRTW